MKNHIKAIVLVILLGMFCCYVTAPAQAEGIGNKPTHMDKKPKPEPTPKPGPREGGADD